MKMVRNREFNPKVRVVKVIEVSPIGDNEPLKKSLEATLGPVFYASKLFGIFPFDLFAFYRRKEFKISVLASLLSVSITLMSCVQFHRSSSEATLNVKENYPSLTFTIYVVIVYSEPLTMVIVVVANILNQKRLIATVQRLHVVEEQLIAEGGRIIYTSTSLKSLILTFILIGGEVIMMIYYIITSAPAADNTFLDIITWFWLFLPITLTSLARLWFIVLMDISELFFMTINKILDSTSDALEAQSNFPARKWTKEPLFDDFLGQKLMRLCHLHAEVGRASLSINRIFHLENLLSMLFTILLTVTQMYFIYLSALNQQVPVLFRAAGNMIISVYYVIFGLWKVFYIIWVASQVKRQAQLTGSYLHQIAVAVDEVACYRLTNQLSLQIWQQRLEFPVGGFYLLDMTTIGSCSGAILVYVIILIQFNLAGGS